MGFSKKGVYHSELVRDFPDGLMVQFKGQPLKSKDKDSWYIYFKVEDGSEHYYNIENGDIACQLQHVPTDQWVKLMAAGSREAATVLIEDDAGPVFAPPREDGPPPNNWPEDPPNSFQRPTDNRRENGKRDRLTEAFRYYLGIMPDRSPASIEAAQKLACTEIIGG